MHWMDPYCQSFYGSPWNTKTWHLQMSRGYGWDLNFVFWLWVEEITSCLLLVTLTYMWTAGDTDSFRQICIAPWGHLLFAFIVPQSNCRSQRFLSKIKPTHLRLFASSFECKNWTLHYSTGKAKFVTVNCRFFLWWPPQWVTNFSDCATVFLKWNQTVASRFECLASQQENNLFLLYSWMPTSRKQYFTETTDLITVEKNTTQTYCERG